MDWTLKATALRIATSYSVLSPTSQWHRVQKTGHDHLTPSPRQKKKKPSWVFSKCVLSRNQENVGAGRGAAESDQTREQMEEGLVICSVLSRYATRIRTTT